MKRSKNAAPAGTEAHREPNEQRQRATDLEIQQQDRPGGFRQAIQRTLKSDATPAERESIQAVRGIAMHNAIWFAGEPDRLVDLFNWLDDISRRRYGGELDLMVQLAGDLEAWLAIPTTWVDPDLNRAAKALDCELTRMLARWEKGWRP